MYFKLEFKEKNGLPIAWITSEKLRERISPPCINVQEVIGDAEDMKKSLGRVVGVAKRKFREWHEERRAERERRTIFHEQ